MNISGVTISGGSTTANGGGLSLSDEVVTLSNLVVSGNTAGTGGGIAAGGVLTIIDSTISGNIANGTTPRSDGGGGVYIGNGGTMLMIGCTISANTAPGGGGIEHFRQQHSRTFGRHHSGQHHRRQPSQ